MRINHSILVLDDKPEGSDYEYDEIFYCRFIKEKERTEFKENESGYWYKILSQTSKVISVRCLDSVVQYPDVTLIPSDSDFSSKKGLNKLTLGLIIETNKGFLPAFLLPSNHGFQWQPKFDFYTQSEVEQLLSDNIEYCKIINCA